MKTNYIVYICVCCLYLLLSVINRIHPFERNLLDIVYISTWGVLLLIEIKKIFVIKRRDREQPVDYFPVIIITLLIMIFLMDI